MRIQKRSSLSKTGAKLLIGLVLAAFLAGVYSPPADAGSKAGPPVKVMTRNLYLGADIFEVVNLPDPSLIPLVIAEKYALMVQNDFEERAKAIASEIAEKDPDLVGLQEVSCFTRVRPDTGGFVPVEQFNYLEILQKAMDDCGLDYEVVFENPNVSITLPMLAGFNPDGSFSLDFVTYSDADAVLVKKGLRTADPQGLHFKDNFEVSLAGQKIVFSRGFVAVEVTIRGKTYLFANAHVENRNLATSTCANVQQSQVDELIGYLNGENLPVILVGDFNLTPQESGYGTIKAAGFTDLWAARNNAKKKKGFTCCQDEDLLNEESALYERIDYIFARGSADRRNHWMPKWPVIVQLTGNDADEDKTESGLWPSDHAGVFAVFRLP